MYLITGATGNVGSKVVAQLLERGKHVRIFVRNPDKAAQWGSQVEVAVGDYSNPAAFAAALQGVEAIFLVNRGADGDIFRTLTDAIKVHGAPKVVFLSSVLATDPDSDIGKLHKNQEDTIRNAGLVGKCIRPGSFMSNAYQWIRTIKTEDTVFNPMGTGKTAPIAPEDIAAAAVAALTEDLEEEYFELTGNELLSIPEQTSILATVLNRPIRCVDISIEAAVQGLMQSGIPEYMAKSVARSFEAIRDGRAVFVRDTVEKLTGKKPRSFQSWAEEHKARFA